MTDIQYIRVGWLLDGSGGPVQKNMLLKIDNGVLAAIEPFSGSQPGGKGVFTDLSFATVLPPLIDCHVHLTMSGSTDQELRKALREAGCTKLEPFIEQHLNHFFTHGVLAVRDGGDRGGCVLGYQQKRQSTDSRVIVKTSGRAWHQPGRYGAIIGREPTGEKTLCQAYRQQGAHVDQVKVVNSGLNSLVEFAKETTPQFSQDEISNLVKMAEADGKKVMVHANGKKAVEIAVSAGCHSIEHGFFMGRENLQMMADMGTFWVPTAYTMKAYAEISEAAGESRMAEIARKNLEHQLAQISLARDLGVKVAAGTDAGSPGVLHGESMVEELKLLIRSGYPLAQAVAAATSVAADLLVVESFGLLAVGRPASFLVARGTPAQLPRKLLYLEDIYLAGRSADGYKKNPVKHVR